MNTNACLYEIQNINKELARLRKKTRELNQRKKELLNRAVENMRESGETSITYQGKTYTLEEQTHRSRKNDKKRHDDTVDILNAEGFQAEEAEEMYEKLLDAYRGPEFTSYRLK